MPSFPSLHDALFSLLPGARAGFDRAPWPGAPGFADGPDADDVDVPRPRGPQGPDVDLPSHQQRPTPGGEGPTRHAASEPGPPPHARGWGPDGAHSHGARSLTPGAAPLEPSLQALARELQQLPPSVIRQLSHALSADPAALRDLPARPEALAIALSRTAAERAAMHPAGSEARPAVHAPDRPAAAARGQDTDAARDARMPGAPAAASEARPAPDTRGATALEARLAMAAGEARPGHATDPRGAWTTGLDPGLFGHVLARPTQPTVELQPPPSAHVDATTVAVPGHSATTAPAGDSQAQPGVAPLPGHEGPLHGARADAGTAAAGERGAQAPGLGGLGGVAAGVTMAAVANPAGTTHAYAPDSAVRARRPQESRDQQNGRADGGTDQEDTPDRHSPDAQQRPSQRGGTGPTAAAAAAAACADAAGTGSPAGHVGLAGVASASQTAERSASAGHGADDAQNRHSRYLQWLYWSLIAVTYCCLGLALATVAPDLFGLPMPPEPLGTWRNALTGAGLLTGLWAWLLARRLR